MYGPHLGRRPAGYTFRLLVAAAVALLLLYIFHTNHRTQDRSIPSLDTVALTHIHDYDLSADIPVTSKVNTSAAATGDQPSDGDDAADATPALDADVWWFAPFLDHSSFGVEAAGYVLPLLRHRLVARDRLHIGLLQDSCEDQQAGSMAAADHAELMGLRGAPAQPAIVICHNLPPYLGRPFPRWRSCAPCPPPHSPSLVRYAVGRAVTETDRIPPDFVAALNSLDEVWAPSEASAAVLRGSGVVAGLRVVPLPVDTEELHPRRGAPLPLPPQHSTQVFGSVGRPPKRPFVFISVFKWELRKGYDVLLRAFLQEFGRYGDPKDATAQGTGHSGNASSMEGALQSQDGGSGSRTPSSGGLPGGAAPLAATASAQQQQQEVELVILTKPFLPKTPSVSIEEVMRQWARDALGPGFDPASAPRVHVLSRHVPRSEYVGLLAAADAFVLPTRGEGWGIPIVEAMSLGLPVIATNWSGPTAYLDEQVGYPLPYTGLVEVPHTEPYWFRGSRWAEPSVPELRRLMRHVVGGSGRAEAAARGRAARRRMEERYSQRVVARQVASELRRIADQTAGAEGRRR